MEDKTLTVIVSPDGSGIRVEVDGVVGTSCENLTKTFEKLGAVSHKEKKSEYYLTDQIPISVEQ